MLMMLDLMLMLLPDAIDAAAYAAAAYANVDAKMRNAACHLAGLLCCAGAANVAAVASAFDGVMMCIWL